MNAPAFPAGEYRPEPAPTPERRRALIAEIAAFPESLAPWVQSLPSSLLDMKYRNWTVRQIVHHLADSHINAYVRFRLALTEERPTIKPYIEGKWVELPDAKTADVAESLAILTAIHRRWTLLMTAMSDDQWERIYVHPEYGQEFRLGEALGLYAHHGRHHRAQIEWLSKK
jgi:uncharacterized damage-inducible protein DinB